MNSKLMKASLAGVAAIAVAAGGSTFAAWSDFQTQGAQAGAGYLRLNLSDAQGTDTNVVQPMSLAPGQHKTQNFYIASADSGNTPVGKVTAFIADLVDTEDTAAGTCTTASEAVAEGSTNCSNPAGELSQQATVEVSYRTGVTGPGTCAWDTIPPAGRGNTLAQLASGPTVFDLGNLSAGQGVCLVVEVSLPLTATNATQGDDAAWTWHFDLTQV